MSSLKKRKHENVMLMSMSTFPPFPKYNTYTIKEDGNDLYFKSIAQMEPHTKYVLYKLASMNETLDRIVILESEKARTEKPEKWKGETATTVFKKRIEEFLRGTAEDLFELEDTLSIKSESSLPVTDGHNLYADNTKPEIITIDLEDQVYFWHAVNAIRGGSRRNIHLYMDMQGGDRNTISQMNAIVELLGRQGVTVMGRYANDFDHRRKIPLHTIRDASSEYRTYDLISAMDAFSRYGWGDSLEDFFKDRFAEDSKEGKLIKFIDQASTAISRCNPDGFDSAIDEIAKLGEAFKEPGTITEMDVVYRDIQEDYASLYNAKYRYVEQIRWCLDKKFLQQALTILEAKMPHEFVRSGMIYYLKDNASEQERSDFLDKCEEIYNGLTPRDRYRMKDLTHFLIKDYCIDHENIGGNEWFKDPENLLHFGLGDSKKNAVLNLLKKYLELCGDRNKMNHAGDRNHAEGGFFRHMQNKYSDDYIWRDIKEKDYDTKIRNFLNNWTNLANNEKLSELRGKTLDLS